MALGELLGVGQEQDVVALDLVDLAPGVHDPGIVVGNDGDVVDALALELLKLGDVGRQVVGLAAGSEGTGDRDNDDLLALPLLGGIVLLGTTALGGVGVEDGNPAGGCCQPIASGKGTGCAYSNLTPAGNLSPTWRGAIVLM